MTSFYINYPKIVSKKKKQVKGYLCTFLALRKKVPKTLANQRNHKTIFCLLPDKLAWTAHTYPAVAIGKI